MKKIVIALLVLLAVCASFIPIVTSKMAEEAFNKPTEKSSQDALMKSIQIDMRLSWYGKALKTAEKAVIYFPESENIGYYIYTAAFCAEQENKNEVAVHWYNRFIKIFPKSPMAQDARNRIAKLKDLKGR